MTKRCLVVLAALTVLTAAATARADNIKTGDTLEIFDWDSPKDLTNNGFALGEYGGPLKAVANGDSWMTFCLELSEGVKSGVTYYVRTNSGTENGGYGGQLPGTNFDPLSDETAWVYWNYSRNGNPNGWLGQDVQYFIWFQENETNQYLGSGDVSQFAKPAGWTNDGRVIVLNLYKTAAMDPTNDAVQDMIAVSSIPEPATMLLVGTGLVGLATRRRRAR